MSWQWNDFGFTASCSERRGGGNDSAGKVEKNNLSPFCSVCQQHTSAPAGAAQLFVGSARPDPMVVSFPSTRRGSQPHRPPLIFSTSWGQHGCAKSHPVLEAWMLPGFLPGSSPRKTSLTRTSRRKHYPHTTALVLRWTFLLGKALRSW